MTQEEWLTAADTRLLLKSYEAMGDGQKMSFRKIRLISCAITRSHRIVESLTEEALDIAEDVIEPPDWEQPPHAYLDEISIDWERNAIACCLANNPLLGLNQLLRSPAQLRRPVKPDPFRDIIGNPWLRVDWLQEWRTRETVGVAQEMYESRDFSSAPVLADALQDAGCTNRPVLRHLLGECELCDGYGYVDRTGVFPYDRDACPACDSTGKTLAKHWRGCWVVDLVLGKE